VDRVYTYVDARGRYRLGDLTGAGTPRGSTGDEWRGVNPTSFGRLWRRPPAVLEELLGQGLIQLKKDGKPSINGYKMYLMDSPGVPVQDVWTDIPNVTGISSEKLGWPTQKPLAFLERMIATSSNPGDIVLDPFCGCGTALVAAQSLAGSGLGSMSLTCPSR
jgi:hypothetical protein